MFEKVYLAVDSKIEPDLKLIHNTKNRMYEELKNRTKVRTMNFYKYASIAACLVLFIGVLSVNQKINQPIYEVNNFVESTDSYPTKTDVNDSVSNGNPFNTAFNSATSGATSSTALKSETLWDKVIDFFSSIVQWFKELLF